MIVQPFRHIFMFRFASTHLSTFFAWILRVHPVYQLSKADLYNSKQVRDHNKAQFHLHQSSQLFQGFYHGIQSADESNPIELSRLSFVANSWILSCAYCIPFADLICDWQQALWCLWNSRYSVAQQWCLLVGSTCVVHISINIYCHCAHYKFNGCFFTLAVVPSYLSCIHFSRTNQILSDGQNWRLFEMWARRSVAA